MDAIIAKRHEMPKAIRELNVILTLAVREIKMTLKAPEKLMMAVMFPIMMFGLFGSQLSQNMGFMMNYDFQQFMLIGMLVNAMFMMSMMGVASLAEDRENDFTQEIFVAPVSRGSIMLGKIIGASFNGWIQFFATIIIGLVVGATLSVGQFWLMLALSPLMALASGAIGVLILGLVKSASAADMAIMMFSMIQTFVSGAMIPVSNSSGAMAVLNHIMPMTYAVDLARGICYYGTDVYDQVVMYPPWLNLLVVISFTMVFFALGTWLFVRSEKNK
jgi:ABC-2 type transport system permease protein